jgi:cobalt-zinc-cadmium efflux system protein
MHQTQHQKKLFLSIILSLGFMLTEFIGGLITGSLALISDAAHMLTDVSALIISWFAIAISKKKANSKKTFGYYRFEILAATLNTCLLFIIGIYIFIEAIKRLNTPTNIHSTSMMLIAGLGLIVNLIAVSILHSSKEDSLNLKSAYLEVMSDALSSVAVIVGGVLIYFTHLNWIDTVIAILIAIWILPRTWVLLKESIDILLEAVPSHIDSQLIEKKIKTIPGILGCHDLHIWSITNNKISLTAHVVIEEQSDMHKIIQNLNDFLKQEFAIEHTTFQLEYKTCEVENHH